MRKHRALSTALAFAAALASASHTARGQDLTFSVDYPTTLAASEQRVTKLIATAEGLSEEPFPVE